MHGRTVWIMSLWNSTKWYHIPLSFDKHAPVTSFCANLPEKTEHLDVFRRFNTVVSDVQRHGSTPSKFWRSARFLRRKLNQLRLEARLSSTSVRYFPVRHKLQSCPIERGQWWSLWASVTYQYANRSWYTMNSQLASCKKSGPHFNSFLPGYPKNHLVGTQHDWKP